MTTPTLAEIEGWDADEARERLSASPQDVAAILKVAAEAGQPEAQALYGQVLLDGLGTQADAGHALRWFSQAATAGHVMAMNMVGRCCEHGWGTAVDKVRAAAWYEAAADRGLDWGMYNLATLLCLGEGVAMDRERAFALYRKAADGGHAKSMNLLGGFYEDGWVVARDMAAAADLYRRSAEGGDFRGQFNHARMLLDAGARDEAGTWLAQSRATATPEFRRKCAAWLAHRGEPELAAPFRTA